MLGLFKHKTRAADFRAELERFKLRAQMETSFTPDVRALERRPYQRLFVYDVMMRGHHKHRDMLQDHAEFRATAFTTALFTLWRKNLGPYSFPVALSENFTTQPAQKIMGELYKIRSTQIIELDKQLENTVAFERIRVKISIPHSLVILRHLKERREIPAKDGGEPTFTSWEHELQPQKPHIIEAWMYVGISDYWTPQLDNGYRFSPVRRFEGKSGQYYYYSQMEYGDPNNKEPSDQ